MRHVRLPLLVIPALLMSSACHTQPHYRIAHTFPVPGDGGWDYIAVDDSSGRLFASHGTVLQIVDEKAGTLLGTVPDCKGVHGIALANDLGKGFISCGRDSSVVVIDLKSYATTARVKVAGADPDAILYDAFSHKVFVFNAGSDNATVLDAATNAVITTIPLAGAPEFAQSDGAGTIYVNIEDKSLICAIDANTMKVLHDWPIAPGEEPSGLALDNATHRLFSVCGNKLMVVVDAQSGKVITTLPIGDRVDGVMFDATSKRAYSSNGEGTMTVIQEAAGDKFTVLETVPTRKGARTCAVDQKTHHIFLPTAEYGDAPAATTENPHPRRSVKPGTFVILDVEPVE